MVRTCDHGLVHRWQLVAYNDRVNNSISLSARRKHFYTRRFSVWTDKEDLDGMELEDFFGLANEAPRSLLNPGRWILSTDRAATFVLARLHGKSSCHSPPMSTNWKSELESTVAGPRTADQRRSRRRAFSLQPVECRASCIGRFIRLAEWQAYCDDSFGRCAALRLFDDVWSCRHRVGYSLAALFNARLPLSRAHLKSNVAGHWPAAAALSIETR